MTIKDAKNRSSEIGQGHQGSKPESQPRSLGAFSTASAKHGTYQIGTSGKDSNEPNTVVAGEQSNLEIGGKLVRQLVSATEKELAYHEQQAKYHQQQAASLKQRVQELKQIPETFVDADIEHQE